MWSGLAVAAIVTETLGSTGFLCDSERCAAGLQGPVGSCKSRTTITIKVQQNVKEINYLLSLVEQPGKSKVHVESTVNQRTITVCRVVLTFQMSSMVDRSGWESLCTELE